MNDSENSPVIIKAAAVVLNPEGHLLIVKKKGSEIWISLGGKQEKGETLEETLRREVFEELQIKVKGNPVLFHTSSVEPASDKPNLFVRIYSFFIEIEGVPTINPEDNIEAYHWLSKQEFESKKYQLGSVLEKFIVPMLIENGRLN
jgi:8-oxo-dGTP pyrophosphatase MutT (NUDIX family)